MLTDPAPTRARRIALVAVLTAVLSGGVLARAGGAAADPAPVQDVAGTTILTGIACDDVMSCVAVGNNDADAVVVPVTNGQAGSPVPVPQVAGITLLAVACGSAGHCVAVGQTDPRVAYVVPIDHGVPGTPVPVPGADELATVACPSASLCVAGGFANSEIVVAITTTVASGRTTAVPGPVQIPPGSPDQGSGSVFATSIACATASTCYAVSDNFASGRGSVVPIVDGVAGTAVLDVGNDAAIACPAAHLCYSFGSYLRIISDGVPVTTSQPAPIEVRGLACTSAVACVAIGTGGAGFPITDANIGPVQSVDGVGTFRGLACPSATTCYAVGAGPSTGVLTTLTPPTATSPANESGTAGGDATFTVSPTGSPTPAVQWQVSDDGGTTFTDIPGANTARYTVRGVTRSQDGERFRVVVRNISGTATSGAGTLSVGTAPAITSDDATSFTIGAGGTFDVTATGDPAPALSVAGDLPGGVTFTSGPAGSATLAGTPAAGSAGRYPITITATNGIAPVATQTFTLAVTKASTTTSLASDADHATAGDTITLTATVEGPSGAGKPSGSVDLFDGGTKIGSAALVGDPVATFGTSALTVGTHQLTATYRGDASFAAASSGPPVTVVIAAAPTPPTPPTPPTTPATSAPATPPTSVLPTPTTSEVSLPDTGAHTASLLGVATALLLAGGLALLIGSSRRRVGHRH